MKLIRIYAVFLRQLFLLRHNWTRFSNIFLWITVDIILWGFLTKYLNVVSSTGFSFVPILLGAVILWNFLVRIQQGVVLPLLEDVWSQNFLNYFASPLKIGEYVIGLILTSIITSSAGFVIMLILASFIFGFNILGLGFNLVLFLITLFLFGLALGIFTCGIVLRLGPSAEWIAWPISAVVSPLVGVLYPISTLPHSLQIVAKFLPPSYVFEGLRQLIALKTLSIYSLSVGMGLSLLYLFLSYAFFNYIYRKVIRSGLITKFSAESSY